MNLAPPSSWYLITSDLFFKLDLEFPRDQDAYYLEGNSTIAGASRLIGSFQLEVFESEKPCGVSNLSLNSQVLAQEWDGVNAWGNGSITTQSLGIRNLQASWKTSCIFDTIPKDGSNSLGEDVAQYLTFTIDQVDGKDVYGASGFTVSFRQITPEILRISDFPVPSGSEAESPEEWRNPPPPLRFSSPTADHEEYSNLASIEVEINQLKQLKAEAKELKRLIKQKKKTIKGLIKQGIKSSRLEIQQCDSIRCVVKAMIRKAHGAIRMVCHRFGPSEHNHHRHPPTPENVSDDPTPASEDLEYSHPHHNIHPHFLPQGFEDHHRRSPLHKSLKALKICAVIIGLVSFFVLIFKKCRSPRRRADFAARREERRNRRLYRRATRQQRWRNWFCRREQGSSEYDEKRALILEQEGVLETAMQAEIHELRNAHEVVNDIVRAEEGRYIRELDGGLMRENSLPDYDSRSESGGTEPPSYEEQIVAESVVDGFQYTPQGSEGTPASSVVDTSPRISMESRETRDFKE
ncbi:MAG: hypothetical protein M1830_008956 [Pleopsidium flavum]|nr:MAG: hypothetical protein M1830_008956 [Pleopsidium flavum]